ncbi:MAG: transporter [Gammaproteobacteria bacterium]|nr:transporter [Gammaproteobacteria bacterium]
MDYSQGDYGATIDTEIWYIPFAVKLEQADMVYKLTVPMLAMSGPGNVIGVDAVPGTGNPNERHSEAGMGDTVVAVSKALLPYQPGKLFLELTGKIKLPTADETRGLGTGKIDYAIQIDPFYGIRKTSLFATLGYKLQGDPPDITYRNILYYSLGIDYAFTEQIGAGLIYDYRQAGTAGGIAPEELTVYLHRKLDNSRKLLIYLLHGLSDGSPDMGLGINVSYILK